MTILGWLAVAASLWGTVLNIRRDYRCFYLWLPANAVWVGIDAYSELWHQAALQAVYLGLSVWGLWAWRSKA